MDIENLNKSQMVLLTLLVSFITSIATGIVTVSLLQQAPPVITETVNRVIEHTVERVVTGQTAAAAAPETQTVIVKETDAIAKSVEALSPSIVRVYTNEGTSTAQFLAIGVVIDQHGVIATDAGALAGVTAVQIELPGGARVKGHISSRAENTGIAYVTGATSTATGLQVPWKPAPLVSSEYTLGETVVVVAGKTSTRIGQGILTSVQPLSSEAGTPAILETNLSKDAILSGSPIMDTGGNILGISTSVARQASDTGFIASSSIPPLAAKEKATD